MDEKIRGLLSIDVNAHLQKLASFSFKSRHHYPVEIVRSSLRRKAKQVKIVNRKSGLQVMDNGSGISSDTLHLLIRIMNASLADEVREKAIADLRRMEKMGLFALFSPNPEKVIVENVFGRDKKTLVFEKGKVTVLYSCSILFGTKIYIQRRIPSTQPEINVLRDFCRGVPQEIYINGKPIDKKSFVFDSLAYTRLRSSDSENTDAEIGIPKQGDVCKIWLLEKGIPWSFTTRSPVKGLVFDAALETDKEIDEYWLERLASAAKKLYVWLIKRYPELKNSTRLRIEELIFKQFKLTRQLDLINQFPDFTALYMPYRLTLPHLKKLALDHNIYAISQQSDARKYNTKNKLTLVLNPRQRDFLMNYSGITMHFLSPTYNWLKRFIEYFLGFQKKMKYIVAFLSPGSRKIISLDQLQAEEKKFLRIFWEYLNGNPDLLFNIAGTKIQIFMVKSRYLFQSFIKKEKGIIRIFIRRSHPVTQKSVEELQKDPKNIEMIAPLFLY